LIEEKDGWGCLCFKVLRNNIEQGFFSFGSWVVALRLLRRLADLRKKNPPFNFKTA
jgi:hypothetical protein